MALIGTQDSVVIRFIIEKDGNVSDLQITKSVN